MQIYTKFDVNDKVYFVAPAIRVTLDNLEDLEEYSVRSIRVQNNMPNPDPKITYQCMGSGGKMKVFEENQLRSIIEVGELLKGHYQSKVDEIDNWIDERRKKHRGSGYRQANGMPDEVPISVDGKSSSNIASDVQSRLDIIENS